MYDPLFGLDGSTLDLKERPPFLKRPPIGTIDFKTWKLNLFMPKVDPKIRVISGPEIMYLQRMGEREREREEMKKVERYRLAQKLGLTFVALEWRGPRLQICTRHILDPIRRERGGGGAGGCICIMQRRESIPSNKYMCVLTIQRQRQKTKIQRQ
jgi:hypothetical protein